VAASSAASVNKNCRFSVEDGKIILEAVGMNRLIDSPERLFLGAGATLSSLRPGLTKLALRTALPQSLSISYLKARFAC
jgi:hypothetical protein